MLPENIFNRRNCVNTVYNEEAGQFLIPPDNSVDSVGDLNLPSNKNSVIYQNNYEKQVGAN